MEEKKKATPRDERKKRILWLRGQARELLANPPEKNLNREAYIRLLVERVREKYKCGASAARDYASLCYMLETRPKAKVGQR